MEPVAAQRRAAVEGKTRLAGRMSGEERRALIVSAGHGSLF